MITEFNPTLLCEVAIDTEALFNHIADRTPVFEDAYGNGVALVNGVSYATYHELAEGFNVDILNFGETK